MNIFNENEEAPAFTLGLIIGAIIATVIIVFVVCREPDDLPKVCRDGMLFEVSHEGNITIYESAYRECEETK